VALSRAHSCAHMLLEIYGYRLYTIDCSHRRSVSGFQAEHLAAFIASQNCLWDTPPCHRPPIPTQPPPHQIAYQSFGNWPWQSISWQFSHSECIWFPSARLFFGQWFSTSGTITNLCKTYTHQVFQLCWLPLISLWNSQQILWKLRNAQTANKISKKQ